MPYIGNASTILKDWKTMLNNQDIVNDKLISQQCPDNINTDSRTNLGSTSPLLSKPFEVFKYAVLNL
jgi:hypothetical protein